MLNLFLKTALSIKGLTTLLTIRGLNFNNSTFNQGTYNFNASKVSFSCTNTLNSSSPFASLKGSVSFGSGAIFNLNQTLNSNQTYDILTTNKTIQYGVYQSYLWDLINYKGDKAISHVEVGSNTYDVTLTLTAKMKPTRNL